MVASSPLSWVEDRLFLLLFTFPVATQAFLGLSISSHPLSFTSFRNLVLVDRFLAQRQCLHSLRSQDRASNDTAANEKDRVGVLQNCQWNHGACMLTLLEQFQAVEWSYLVMDWIEPTSLNNVYDKTVRQSHIEYLGRINNYISRRGSSLNSASSKNLHLYLFSRSRLSIHLKYRGV